MPIYTPYRKKFLLKNLKINFPLNTEKEIFEETIVYLREYRDGYHTWIKKIEYESGNKAFSYCERKIAKLESERLEISRKINKDTYYSYLKQKDPNFVPLKEKVISFIWKKSLYQIEDFGIKNGAELKFLRVSSKKSEDQKIVTEFLGEMVDVSEDQKYFTRNLALIRN